jgi:hypothetical protein
MTEQGLLTGFQIFTRDVQMMTVFFWFLHCVVKVCSDVSDKRTASIFRDDNLVQMNAEVTGRNLLII